jgi:hypothetical protein
MLAIALFRPGDLSYVLQTGSFAGLREKEVIHVSLSLCRGIVAGLDHLERRLDWRSRLIVAAQ